MTIKFGRKKGKRVRAPDGSVFGCTLHVKIVCGCDLRVCVFCSCVDCVCVFAWGLWVCVGWVCVWVCECVWGSVCVWTVGGLLDILVAVSFPPLLLRPWSDHFYARDSFMKHKTWSNTWHEIGNKAEQKGEQFSGRMCSQYG